MRNAPRIAARGCAYRELHPECLEAADEEDIYICPAGDRLAYHYTNEENGLVLRRYWTNAWQSCAIKQSCTTAKERRITRWEHEHILEAV